MTYFSTYEKPPQVVREALDLVRRAVAVLQETHGEEALWTLAATYRMAVCLYDLQEHEQAM